LTYPIVVARSGVARVSVIRGGNKGCHPYFFPEKKLASGDLFVITVCQFCSVTPTYFLLKNGRPFLLITVTFIDFTRVSRPLEGVTRTFFTCPTS